MPRMVGTAFVLQATCHSGMRLNKLISRMLEPGLELFVDKKTQPVSLVGLTSGLSSGVKALPVKPFQHTTRLQLRGRLGYS